MYTCQIYLWYCIYIYIYGIAFTDSQPPLLKRCPNNIYTYASKTGPSDPVIWASPLSEDNSGISFVNQTLGPVNGSSFPVGQTEIRYNALDLDGNVSPECVFFVIVEGNELCYKKKK